MIKQTKFALIVLTITFISCNSNSKKSTEQKDSVQSPINIEEIAPPPSEVIESFVQAYTERDNQRINELIHPDLGLYIIYRPGAMDTYEKVDSLNFSKPFPPHFPYTTFKNEYSLSFEELPEFDCGYDRWNKLGFFCDTTAHAQQLTRIADFQKEFNEIQQSQLEAIKEFEKDSYRVILTKNENLIFHIKKYQGAWYVVVLDRAYGWCDA